MNSIFGKIFSYMVLSCGFFIIVLVVNSADKFTNVKVISYQKGDVKVKYPEILNIIKCDYKPMEFKVVQKSNFWVFYNFIKAKKRFKCHESITLTTNADFRYLDNLVTLVKRWKGPISLAIYAPGEDFFTTLDSIAYLRNCETVLIKEYVTFHIYFDFNHTPHKKNTTAVSKAYKDTFSCSKKPPYQIYIPYKTYKATHNLTYPINVARNIAREAAQTYFVFPSDIELYPTYNFIEKFLKMLVKNQTLLTDRHPKVYVLPIFEILENASVPATKTELQQMHSSNTAFLFHKNLCAICHKVPKDQEWMKANETDELNVFTVGKRLKYHRFWEAFYVGTNAEPIFDERLTWEGQSNKMVQGFALCLLDYDYMVLDNAFLIHKPGIKKVKEQTKKYGALIAKTNYLVRHHVKPELEALYGRRDGCVLQ